MLDIEKWTPLATFGVAYAFAVFCAIGAMLKTAEDGGALVTVNRIVNCFFYWGPLSVSVPMLAWGSPLVAKSQIVVIAMAALIGLGIIKVSDLFRHVRGILNMEEPSDDKQDHPSS